MKKRSKKYTEAVSKVEKSRVYSKEEAVKLVKETSISSFDGSVEVAMRLNLDTKKADQQLRGAIVLPKGTGTNKKVLVIARGPKGLMPNPKTGTVTLDIAKAVQEVKAGRVEYRTDSFGNVHGVIGKVSFSEEDLLENLDAFISQIIRIKPATVKGEYVKNISISSTMGPGIKVENNFDK